VVLAGAKIAEQGRPQDLRYLGAFVS